MTPLEKVIDALERHDCNPRQIGPGLWLAACPSCREKGRVGLLEVHEQPGGTIALGCEDEKRHELGI